MIKIYTLPYCPYCINTLRILNKMNINYENIIVNDYNKNEIKKKHNYNTFPQIFFKINNELWDNTPIGYNDLELIIKISNIIKDTNIDNGTLFLALEILNKKNKLIDNNI